MKKDSREREKDTNPESEEAVLYNKFGAKNVKQNMMSLITLIGASINTMGERTTMRLSLSQCWPVVYPNVLLDYGRKQVFSIRETK